MDMQLWLDSEKALIQDFSPEHLRTSGLLSVKKQRWQSALLRLEAAVSQGINDLQTLDALGEAAYKAKMPEALLPLAAHYRHPMIATHLIRALLLLGEHAAAQEHLVFAENSLLKTALVSLLGVKENIQTSIEAMLAPLLVQKSQKDQTDLAGKPVDFSQLSLTEYWQALAAVADAAENRELTELAERRSKFLAYTNPVIHYNQALRLLAQGEFRAGWKLYEWRLVPGSQCAMPTSLANTSMWEGEDLKDKSLLIVVDFGFGDQLFGLRYIRALMSELAPDALHIAVSKELWALVKENFPQATLHPLEGIWQASGTSTLSRHKIDFWCYSLSIPARFYCTEPIHTSGYLVAPADLVKAKRDQIQKLSQQLNLQQKLPVKGLVWRGDMATLAMRTRAYSLTEFLKVTEVLKTPSLIICLQKGVSAEELQILASSVIESGGVLLNAEPGLVDFACTAAWMANLDHLYSCDTSTAHLAGALAVSTTVLIRNKSIWHWRQENEKSVWYDSVQVKYALAMEYSYMFEIRSSDRGRP